jgi:hypothetical protein
MGGKMSYHKCRKGTAILVAMIVLAILSAWAVSISSISNVNAQLAANQRKANRALESAQSGLDIMRYWMGHVYMPGTVMPNDRFNYLGGFLESDLAAYGISNIPIALDVNNIAIGDGGSPVVLYSLGGQNFSAQILPTGDIDKLQMDVTGSAGAVERTIRVNYNFGTRENTVFDFGIATKGPLNLIGNTEVTGANTVVDAGVYIESPGDINALTIIGNSQIAGDVDITNPDAEVTLQGGQAGIGGETGQDAIDNHVEFGAPPTDFPIPLAGYFEQYVEDTYDPNDVLTEYENVRILAGTDPTFSGGVTMRGVVFIEAPNVVTFMGNVDITGIVIGNGDLSDNSETNRIIFSGTVASAPVSDLPQEPQFAQLREETGTFLMAPGFSISFGGNFETLNGAIAANGIEFYGDAGGTIEGSILNYSDNPMTLSGNSDLFFNRSGTTEIPAGFGPEIIMHYVASSYREVVP